MPTVSRVAVGAVALVAVLAIVLGTLHFLSPSSAPHVAKATPSSRLVKIQPAGNGLDCPHDVAWSRDGSAIAVLGYSGGCPSLTPDAAQMSGTTTAAPHVPGLIEVYDTSIGHLASLLHPDTAIIPAIHLSAAFTAYMQAQKTQYGLLINAFDIDYTHVLWSQDGKQLAVTFSVFVPSAPPVAQPNGIPTNPGQTLDGVLLLSLAGGASQVLTTPETATYTEWDLATGTAHPVTGMATTATATITPALSYQWGPNGTLTPQAPIGSATSAAPLTPIGEPDGGSAFTLWQPGVIYAPEGANSWYTNIAAWSPDGRYLAERIVYSGPLVSGPATGQATALPVRDAALLAVLPLAQTHAFGLAPSTGEAMAGTPTFGILVAWQPAGRVLALDASASDNNADADQDVVTLYDCATGKQIATLAPYTENTSGKGFPESGEENMLRWSPDGARLLLLDTQLGTLTIWKTGSLA